MDKFIDVAVDAMVFSREGDQVHLLLVQRKFDPFQGLWAFPGGFVNYNEDPADAVLRELQEETGMVLDRMTQLRTFGQPGRDPRGHTLSVVYYAFTDAHLHPVAANDDAAEVKWVNVRDLRELAFDHMDILDYAMKTLDLGPYSYRGAIS